MKLVALRPYSLEGSAGLWTGTLRDSCQVFWKVPPQSQHAGTCPGPAALLSEEREGRKRACLAVRKRKCVCLYLFSLFPLISEECMRDS